MRKRNKDKKESGQAIVEFAFVLPLFLLLVMGILDFGWLFYNYISLENSARNAARIACVQYEDCCYDRENNIPKNTVFTPNTGEIAADNPDMFTEDEIDIADAVAESLPGSITNGTITIVYSYDKTMQNDILKYDVKDRYTGDVTVTVTGKMRVLTPVLGVFSDNMEKELTSSATYKVERQHESDHDID